MAANHELQIQNYTDDVYNTDIDNPKSLKIAKGLKRQISALKTLITSSMDVEYREKKDIYDEARKEIESKKVAFEKVQSTRLSFTKPLTTAYKDIKKKIENYEYELEQAEILRIQEQKEAEEAEQKRITDGLKAKEEEKKKKEELFCLFHKISYPSEMSACPECKTLTPGAESTQEEEGMKVVSETGVTTSSSCFIHGHYQKESARPDPGQINATQTTEPDAPVPPQKQEEGQNEAVEQEFNVEVFAMAQFIGAIIRGDRGATFDLLQPNIPAIKEFAKTTNCKPGEQNKYENGQVIIPGCKAVL